MCFIPSECFKATTSGFSHQQLVSEPRSSENRSVLWYTWIFKVVKNKFWSFHSVELIHTNSLVQESTSSEPAMSHTRRLKILHRSPTRIPRALEVEDEWRPCAPYASRYTAAPSRPSRWAAISRSRVDRIFPQNIPGSTPANCSPYKIGVLTGSPHFWPIINKVRLVPYYLDHSGSVYSVCFAQFGSQKVI